MHRFLSQSCSMDHHSRFEWKSARLNKLQFIAFGRLTLLEVSTLRFEKVVSLQHTWCQGSGIIGVKEVGLKKGQRVPVASGIWRQRLLCFENKTNRRVRLYVFCTRNGQWDASKTTNCYIFVIKTSQRTRAPGVLSDYCDIRMPEGALMNPGCLLKLSEK